MLKPETADAVWDEVLGAVEAEYDKAHGYCIRSEDKQGKDYWRTYSAGILHALNQLRHKRIELTRRREGK